MIDDSKQLRNLAKKLGLDEVAELVRVTAKIAESIYGEPVSLVYGALSALLAGTVKADGMSKEEFLTKMAYTYDTNPLLAMGANIHFGTTS